MRGPWIQNDRRTHAPLLITTSTTRCTGSACFCTSFCFCFTILAIVFAWVLPIPFLSRGMMNAYGRNIPPCLAVRLYFLETILNGETILIFFFGAFLRHTVARPTQRSRVLPRGQSLCRYAVQQSGPRPSPARTS